MTTKNEVISAVEANTIWLNATKLINPTDKTLREIGETLVAMLQQKENLLPKYVVADECTSESLKTAMEDISKLTPVLYLSVNAS